MTNIRTLTAILSLIVLTGCAQQPSAKTENARSEEKAAAQAATASANAEAAAKQVTFPATIAFTPASTKLDQPQLDAIAEVARQLPASAKITVTGHADKKLGDARNKATARGLAVKAALVKNGIPAKSIRVKYATAEAKNEATIALND